MGAGSMSHWLIVLAVVLLLFGAKKIPELAKGVGKGIKDFKNAVKEDEVAQTTPPKEVEKSTTHSTVETKETTKA
ncbi:MAG: preprotein translocase subunit TatA [Sulfurovum sp. AS07-7]|jgi:sec-independent protein translocase protein TatA|nr:MAG: preprotein translocase subunit TatA [Sulfurovum sp. AS07-7]MBD3795107.1 twin-arginine translocase TatA/TatE family subunit [Campylobacterota bacterium]MBD3839403.1 twin-arginine translocase TatA/TatE family subunit [Campylobacterota bacterium]TQV63088.1 MAG: twin-arginine translocase TatA/TatE family subunit [Sulfurovum sp.]